MSRPRRNTRHFNEPPGIGNPPPPGFQTVLNSLLAQRDAALGVPAQSQPVARWESSSQPEILWELLAERRRVGIPPSLSQEQNAAIEAAIAHNPVQTVETTIAEMETAVSASQGASPALTIVSDTFWNALQDALPASGIPELVTSTPAFQTARQPTASGGLSPMDISSEDNLPPPRHNVALLTSSPALGDNPEAPILLSSDSESPQVLQATGSAAHVPVVPAEPLLSEGGGEHVASQEGSDDPARANAGERSSDESPFDSVSSYRRDVAHPLELSSDSPLSSFHSSQAPDIPDMGSARRGGKMSTAKATEALEEAGPGVLARARYLNVIPARDTKSITPDREPTEVKRSLPILQLFANTPLTDGSVFMYELMREAHEEAVGAMAGITDELNRVWEGFSHYFLREPLELLNDPSVPIEGAHLRRMADIVGAVLSGGPKSMTEGESDVWASLLPGDWFRLATFITAAIAQGCIRTQDIGRKGAFDIEPCKDNFIHDDSLTRPPTQRDLLMAVSAQVQEELKDEGALLLQDSIDGLRATVWRTHEGQIRAWTEREVLSVYN
jgi:hypothetical protein